MKKSKSICLVAIREKDKREKISRRLTAFMKSPISIGVTGSTARGVVNKDSDLDFFMIIESDNIRRVLDEIYLLKTFQIPSLSVVDSFRSGRIGVLFLYGEIKGVQVNIEIYSLKIIKSLLNLKKIKITRFRTKQTNTFLKFGNAYGGFLPVNMEVLNFAEGNLSILPGCLKKEGTVYIGNHLNKILFSKIYKDDYNIRNSVYKCFSYFVKESIKRKSFSKNCFLNLSVYKPGKEFNEAAQSFYLDLCLNIKSSLTRGDF